MDLITRAEKESRRCCKFKKVQLFIGGHLDGDHDGDHGRIKAAATVDALARVELYPGRLKAFR